MWGLAYASHRNRLFLLQKRAVRLICHSPSKSMHTDPLFIGQGILKLNNINHYVLQLFMFRFHPRKLPVIFDDMFTRNDDIHSHDTRQKLHLHVPLPKTNLVKMSVCYTGVTWWNYYTKFIDTYCSLDVYKKILKMYLHKHQWKCRVSTMFIYLILVTFLITNGCNITVYLLYLNLQPVYPIQFIQQQLVYFQCVYNAHFAPVVCTLQIILFREYRSLWTSMVSCSICHHYCWLSCFVFS